MRVAVDVDGVLADRIGPVLEYVRDHLLSAGPVDGAVEAMAALHGDHELLIATHWPPEPTP